MNGLKKIRGETGRKRMRLDGEKPSMEGACESVGEVVRSFGGDVWKSSEAKVRPEQQYPGHTVGVIKTRGRLGVVIDFTDANGPIVGQVRDVNDKEAVRSVLNQISGAGDWIRQNR